MARGSVNLYIGFETGADCCTGLSVQVIGQYPAVGQRTKFGCGWRCLMRNAAALVSARASALRLSATTDAAHSPDHRAFCELWAIDRFRARMVSPRRGLAHGSHALAGPASTSRRAFPPICTKNLARALELRAEPDSGDASHHNLHPTPRPKFHARNQHRHLITNE